MFAELGRYPVHSIARTWVRIDCLAVSRVAEFSRHFLCYVMILNVSFCLVGSEILSYISHLEHANCQFKMAQERVDGWLDPWHIEVKKQFNDCHLDFACTMLNSCLQIYEAVKWPLEECLSFHFDGESVNEFITVKVDGNMKKSLDLLTKLRSIKSTRPVGSDPSIVD